jgi:cerevisin
MSDVVKGVEWAAEAHVKKAKAAKEGKVKGFKGSVANMSLGGGSSRTLDLAVNAAVAAGMHFAVAAGNDNADACNYSPAAAENAVTVGASTLGDERAYFSNYGKCTDIFAPGLNILSTWIGSKYAVNTISGTSMASPHIAGLLAYYVSLQPSQDSAYAVEEITPKKLKEALITVATVDALTDIPSDTPNVSLSISVLKDPANNDLSSLPGTVAVLPTTRRSWPTVATRLPAPLRTASTTWSTRPRSSSARSTARSRTLLPRRDGQALGPVWDGTDHYWHFEGFTNRRRLYFIWLPSLLFLGFVVQHTESAGLSAYPSSFHSDCLAFPIPFIVTVVYMSLPLNIENRSRKCSIGSDYGLL